MAQGNGRCETVLLRHYLPVGRLSVLRPRFCVSKVDRRVASSSETSQHTQTPLQPSAIPARMNLIDILELR